MHEGSSHGSASRERVAENVYRRRTKRGDIVYELTFRDVGGRQRTKKLAASSERAAVREARGILARRDGGERVTPGALTLRAFVDGHYQPHIDSLAVAGRRSEQGVRLYRDTLRLHVLPALGDLKLAAIDGADVAKLLRTLSRYSESVCHNALTVLGGVFRLAQARKLVSSSPLADLDSSERPRRRNGGSGRRLDERELAALVRHASDGYHAAVAVIAYTGMRVSEAAGLRWQDVDFVDREIRVGGQVTRATRSKPASYVPRKGGAPAYAAVMFPALEATLAERLRIELAAGRGREADYVLATRNGRPPHQRNILRAVGDAAAAAGLGKVANHDLRRSVASLLARRGIDPVQASRMTGHSLEVWTRH